MSQIFGTFDLAQWKEDNDTKTSKVIVDSGVDAKLMFHTPIDRSYLCADLGNLVRSILFNIIIVKRFNVLILIIAQQKF